MTPDRLPDWDWSISESDRDEDHAEHLAYAKEIAAEYRRLAGADQ